MGQLWNKTKENKGGCVPRKQKALRTTFYYFKLKKFWRLILFKI